ATHDEQTLLNVVLETSMDALRAQRGMLMSSTPDADELIFAAARGLEQDHLELRRGEGIAGFVAESGTPLRLPGDGEVPERAATEPEFRTALCVPIFSHERVVAVLSLYDKEEGMNFTENDLANLVSLAAQAGVALENILLHNEAQKLSITDGLTGVWNYRYFRMLYEQEIDRSVRFQRPFSLIVCDIDNFKSFNDTYGHQRGDSVLIELATRVKSAIRDVDVLARYGGEEFLLILPETDADGGLRTAEKIRQVVAGEPFGEEIPVTVSAGVAAFPIHGTDGTSLLAAADRAMYQAKALGKNRAVLCWLPESLQASGTG
ncbi:MAG: diguanylate cyclase, partial [Candidatus Methylomirabilales bacterium]